MQLATVQIDGMIGLVAAGVPGLNRENVTLVDTAGVLNANGRHGLQQVPQQLEVARQVANRYETAVTICCFRFWVAASRRFASQESSLRYGDSHVLSQDEAIHPRPANAEQAIGIPGASSNRPPQRRGGPRAA